VIGCSEGRITSVVLSKRRLALNASDENSLGLLDGLQHIDLHSTNGLTGPVPNWLLDLTLLNYVDVGGNQLTGTVPAELGALTGLTFLSLSPNQLTGTVPAELGALTGLTALYLYQNQLTGTLPALPFKQYTSECCLPIKFVCPLPAGAADCKCGGKLGVACDHSACNGNSSGLSDKDCVAWQHTVRSSAYFTKATPPTCQEPAHLLDPCSCTDVIKCDGGRIVSVRLASRKLAFDASKDESLGLLGKLQHLDLWRNSLQGPVPAWVMTLTSLEYLVFGSNQLTGTIPSQLAKLTGLTTLWINDNHLTGAVPSLPFKQYNSHRGCCLYDVRYTNHFACPLPAGANDCNSSSNLCYGQIGVACNPPIGSACLPSIVPPFTPILKPTTMFAVAGTASGSSSTASTASTAPTATTATTTLPTWGRCVSVDAHAAAAYVPAASFHRGSFTCEGNKTSTNSACSPLAQNEWLAYASHWAINKTVHKTLRSSEGEQQRDTPASGSSTDSSTSTVSSAGTARSTSTASSIYSLRATNIKKSTAASNVLAADEKRAVPMGFTCFLVSTEQFAGYWLCSTDGASSIA
jgi:hypothetical protein